MNVAFRADGGRNIGMGHIMRCLSLANEFRKNDCNVYFISKDKESITKIFENGFEVIPLKYTESRSSDRFNYGDMTQLAEEVNDIIETIYRFNIDLLFIDSYNVSKEFFLHIRPHIKKLAYIDDINSLVYPVDILINGNITAEYMDYKRFYDGEILLLGPKYNLIREEFKNLPKKEIEKEVKEIMITTGGSDPFNVTMTLLNCILKDYDLSKLEYNVIVGNGFVYQDEIEKIARRYNNINIYKDPKKISEIMLKSDIAISSGGSTLYELCACGVPILAFIYADNQELTVNKMAELGYIKKLGWYNDLKSAYIISNLKKFIANYIDRVKMSDSIQGLVDGNGTKRVVKIIQGILQL